MGIYGYRQLTVNGNVGSFYISFGVFDNGTYEAATKLCYFNQITFPSSVTSISNGITAFEKTTSTLLHCGGNLVNSFRVVVLSAKEKL